MRIGNKQMFKDYISKLKIEMQVLNNKITNLEKTKNYLVSNLSVHEDYIRSHSNIDYDKVIDLQKPLLKYKLRFSITSNSHEKEISILKIVNSFLVPVNKDLEGSREELKELEKHLVSETVHKTILNTFNVAISDKILEGYTFNLGFGLSIMRIKRTRSNKKNIDWGTSNKLRKDLIAEGKTPLKGTNGGIPWIITFIKEIDFYWWWNKRTCNIPNKSYYRFKPTDYSNVTKKKGLVLGNIDKLRKLEREDSPTLKYFYT